MFDRNERTGLIKAIAIYIRQCVADSLQSLTLRFDEMDRQLKNLPAGPAGPAGERGERGEKGDAGIAGKDGTNGRDGESVHADTIKLFIRDEIERCVTKIPKPIDGRDGKDGLEVTIHEAIDETRVYPRGTFACFKGGIVRFDGVQWKCVLRGIDYETDDLADDARTRIRRTFYTDGTVLETRSSSPVLIYREIFQEGQTYQRGDVVSFGGSAWHCQVESTTAKPAQGTDWKMMVREGRPGRDAK